MTEPQPLALQVPLDGMQLIEASAGTGKTFTLTLLALRLIIERRRRVSQVLVVTFTRAATQELRERLRGRLHTACRLMEPGGDRLRDSLPDARETAALIDAALARGDEDRDALYRRLRQAEQDIDLAAVFTIDGFCLRVLADEALSAGQTLEPPALIGSERDLYDEIALEAWRWACQSPVQAERLAALWPSPAALARQLPDLVRAEVLLPEPSTVVDDAGAALAAADGLLRIAFAAHHATARADFDQAIAGKVLSGNRYTSNTIAKAWRDLDRLMAEPSLSCPALDDLPRIGRRGMVSGANKGKADRVPQSPLFDAVDTWLDAQARVRAQQAQEQLQLVHSLREYARVRLAHWKQTRHVQGFSDLIAQLRHALDGRQGEMLAAGLRTRYPVALVDEFQDTDPQQWAIFERLYRDQAGLALLLVGDPKQAIYGFRGGDVHTYLQARQATDRSFGLQQNFRSRPNLLRAVEAVFAGGGDDAFAEPGIRFTPVTPGGRVADADFLVAGQVAPALTLCALPLREGKAISAARARLRAARACVRRIREWLDAGRRGDATLTLEENGKEITRGVQARDIAVLVSRHQDASAMQQALADAGIASVTAGKRSLFATDEARELLWLLEAVAATGDDRRLRNALATVLIGEDAAAIAALAEDETRHRAWLDAFQAWGERWDRHGPLAMIADRVAEAGPRLLALQDGERRLSNYLQLAETLQEASAAALGATGLTHWLGKRIVEADDNDEAQQLRLESDAKLVQILTMHKSKGLEFPLVFVPFAAVPPSAGNGRKPRLRRYHDGVRRVTRIEIDHGGDDAGDSAAAAQELAQQHAEQLRLLYVAMTRARHALWLAWGPVKDATRTALAALLHRGADGVPKQLDEATIAEALTALSQRAPDAIEIVAPGDESAPVPRLPPEPLPPPAEPNTISRRFGRDWWVYSFSQLSREDDGGEERGADDEPRPLLPAVDSRFVGARFGNALHQALERVQPARWQAIPDPVPEGELTALTDALREQGYGDHELDDGIALLASLVGRTLRARLPEGTRLCELPASAQRAEMEFHFAFRSTQVEALLALLHAHGYLSGRHGFGNRERLEGLMTGKIDLVYEAGNRVYVLDYKSNQLPDYDPATLAVAMRESEYDLQALLYTLAVHRWLRFRLGASYDYDHRFGGVRYLFCRGLDTAGDDHHGVYASKPPRALVDALDALLAPEERS